MKTLYMTGRTLDGTARWEVLGIYSTEAAAVARCRGPRDFVWPFELDQDFPEEGMVMPSVQWPLAEVMGV